MLNMYIKHKRTNQKTNESIPNKRGKKSALEQETKWSLCGNMQVSVTSGVKCGHLLVNTVLSGGG